MALPVNLATCTVTGNFVNLAGTPASGTVTFTPCPARLLDAGATPPTTILGTPIVAVVTAGLMTVDLPATDDDDLNPTDWAYHVSVRLGGDAAYSFCMYAPDGAVDLADVTPIIGTVGDAILAGPPGTEGPPGEGVPTGGATGEILAKASGSDFDTAWVPASAPGVHASTHAAGSTDPVTLEQSQITGLVAGLAAKQPLDADLTAIAALAPSSDAVIQRKVGMWVASTPTEYKADLNLSKSDVGLGNVTNTSDAAKPVSTAQQTALDLKANKSTTITPTAPLTGGGDLSTNRTLAVSTFTSSTSGVVPASGGASTDFLRADGTWTAPAGGGGGGITTEDAVDAVAGALTEGVGIDIAYDDGANTITVTGVADTTKADKTTTISTTAPLTGGGSLAANRTLAITDFTTSTAGAVPTPGGASSGRFLKDDGTWALPPSAVSGLGGVFPFTYNTSTLESITGSQLRGNNTTFPSSTKLWVSETTVDGLNISVGLGRVKLGHQIYIQDWTDSARYALFNVTADALDKGTYWEINVAVATSAGTIPGGKVALQSLSPSAAGLLFSTTTTAPGMTPGSNGATTLFLRGDQTWAAPAGASAASETVAGIAEIATSGEVTTGTDDARIITPLKLKTVTDTKQPLDTDLTTIAGLTATTDNFMVSVSSAWASRTPTQAKATLALDNVTNTSDANKPVSTAQQTALDLKQDKSQTINAQTGTTYTLVLTDAGKIVTLSNAAAITLTVPTNASVAFPVGTSIDLIQLAAGQFTVTGAGPPTISKSMATAKSRTQYSVMTVIKIATDIWVLTGDAAAS